MYHAILLVALLTTGQPASSDSSEADWQKFGRMDYWDDGLSEMCYYDATESIYGKKRKYTRVHLLNRQWMDKTMGVKGAADAPGAVPVLKFNVAEEIPTENYNYRYLTTVFLERPSLDPFKMVTSSQEWCGATFKHLRWGSTMVEIKTFSYFGGEGDETQRIRARGNTIRITANSCTGFGRVRIGAVLESPRPVRGTHLNEPTIHEITVSPAKTAKTRKTSAGNFEVIRVEANGFGEPVWFDIEAGNPHRLIAFSAGGIEGVLKHVEKRAYWNRGDRSGLHPVGAAP